MIDLVDQPPSDSRSAYDKVANERVRSLATRMRYRLYYELHGSEYPDNHTIIIEVTTLGENSYSMGEVPFENQPLRIMLLR